MSRCAVHANIWHYQDVAVVMAGVAGIKCDDSEWDTIKVVACHF